MSIEDSSILDQFLGINDQNWKQDKKYKKLLQLTWDDTKNFFQVAKLEWKLDDKYNWILGIILKEKDGNATSIYEELKDNERDINYKLINRRLRDLFKLNLVEESAVGYEKNLYKHFFFYQLTLNGIVYVILNWHIILVGIKKKKKGSVLTYLLDNYSNNSIIESFLYPYFEINTLRNFPESLSFEILSYLEEICKIIISYTRSQDSIEASLIDGTIPLRIFSWPSHEEDTRIKYNQFFESDSLLRDLLKREMGWDWINEAEFIPLYGENKVLIRSRHLSKDTYIKINEGEKIVDLICGSEKYSSFFRLICKNDSFTIFGKSTFIGRKILEKGFRYNSKRKLLDLIYVIMTKYKGTSSDYYKFVKDDAKFKAALMGLIADLIPQD